MIKLNLLRRSRKKLPQIGIVKKRVTSDKHFTIAKKELALIVKTNTPECLEDLEHILLNADVNTKTFVLNAILEENTLHTVPLLIKLAGISADPFKGTRIAIVNALGRFGDKRAISVIKPLAKEKGTLGRTATAALKKLGAE